MLPAKEMSLFDQFFEAVSQKDEAALKDALLAFRGFLSEKLGDKLVFGLDENGEFICWNFKDPIGFLSNKGVHPQLTDKAIKAELGKLMSRDGDVSEPHSFYTRDYVEHFASSFLKTFFRRDNIMPSAFRKIERFMSAGTGDLTGIFSANKFDMIKGSKAYNDKKVEYLQVERLLRAQWAEMLSEQDMAEDPVDELAEYALNATFEYWDIEDKAEEQVVPVFYAAIASKRLKDQTMAQIIKNNPSYTIAKMENGFDHPISHAEKIKLVDGLKWVRDKRTPFSFILCNNGHFCTMVLYPHGERGVSAMFFDGDAPLQGSYASKWVNEVNDFLIQVSADDRCDYRSVQECHVKVQNKNNCWLSVATFIGMLIESCAHKRALSELQVAIRKEKEAIGDKAGETLEGLHEMINAAMLPEEVASQLSASMIGDNPDAQIEALSQSVLNAQNDDLNGLRDEFANSTVVGSSKPAEGVLNDVRKQMLEEGCFPTLEYKMSWLRGVVDIPIFCFHIYWNVDFVGHRITMINSMYVYMTESSLNNAGEKGNTPCAPEGWGYVWLCVLSVFSERPLIEVANQYIGVLEAQRNEQCKLAPQAMEKKCVFKGDFDKILDKLDLAKKEAPVAALT